jgi:aspartate aminotransferase-like enzyme
VWNKLDQLGFDILADKGKSCDGVVTLQLPSDIDSRNVGDELKKMGFETSYASGYLLERNWLQLCTMGEVDIDEISSAIDVLYSLCKKSKSLIN